MLNILLSNKGETLFQCLKETLFLEKNAPFEKRGVVVQAPIVKEWIKERLAEDLGTAIGLHFFYPETFFHLKQISKLELSLRIEKRLREALREQELDFTPLFPLLKNNAMIERASHRLSRLFLLYETYLEEDPNSWKPSWQKKLFLEMRPFFKEVEIEKQDSLHIFSLNHIPPMSFQFLEKLSETLPVTLYVLTPCHYFWSDLLTEKQRLKLFHKWFEKGVSFDSLEELLPQMHPLLAHFGAVGKGLAALIEDSKGDLFEHFSITSSQAHLFQDKLLQDEIIVEKGPLTLLEALQADLLFLESKENEAIIDESFSIQVHQTSSIKREVETLIETLFKAFEKNLEPKDVLILAPDITPYLPYMKHLFAKEGIPLQIFEEHPLEKEPLIEAFLKLISFQESRFEKEALFTLLDHPEIQKTARFSLEELKLIKRWFENVTVFWGFNEEHKNEILKKNHCEAPFLDGASLGTWEKAFKTLIEKGVFTDELKIDPSQFELLGRFIRFVKNLYKNLKPLSLPFHTLSEWQMLLKDLFSTYFETKDHPFYAVLGKFSLPLKEPFPTKTLLSHLKTALKEAPPSAPTKSFAVTLASIFSEGVVQKKMIALLGMNEGVFPRVHNHEPFDVTNKKLFPKVTELDRMFFLEALILAEEVFYISFSIENSHSLPSLIVKDFLNHIKKRFKKEILIVEKESPFDLAYFKEENLSHSKRHYKEAEAFYINEKTNESSFLDFSKTREISFTPTDTTLKELKQFAKNPLRRYFQKELNLYLREEEVTPLPSDEPFSLNRLTLYQIKQKACSTSVERALNEAKERLPFGPFYKAAKEVVEKAFDKHLSALKTFGVLKEEGITFLLKEGVNHPFLEENLLFLPPLIVTFSSYKVKITGELGVITPQGLLLDLKDDPVDLLKGWPEYLVYLRVIEENNLNYPKTLLCLKSQKKWNSLTSSNQLEMYLEEFFLSEKKPSLLLPEWIPSLLEKEESELREALIAKLNHPFEPLFNPYIQFGIDPLSLTKDKNLLRELKNRAKTLFGESFS